MKPQIAVWLLASSIFMFGCQKDDQLVPEKIKPTLLANTLNSGGDDITGSLTNITTGYGDHVEGPGTYWSTWEGEIQGGAYFYYGKVEIDARYRARNLTIMVTLPYQYVYRKPTGRLYKIGAVSGEGECFVTFIGTQGQMHSDYVHGSVNDVEATGFSPYWLQTDGNVIYGAAENRTVVTSMTGNIKMMAGFQAEVIHAGMELEEGFTVQSSENEVGYHTGEVFYTIKGYTHQSPGLNPNITRTANLTGVFHGTPKD